jgi:hypothetical protein
MDSLSISNPSSAVRKQNCLCLEDELRANLMRRTQGARVIKSLSVKGKTEGSFDARTECLGVSCTKMPWVMAQNQRHERYLPRARTPELLILALMKAAESR